MPLYEMILLCRCSQAQNTSAAIRTLSQGILSNGGNIRNIKVLGDRILSKALHNKDGQHHLIGRYISILYDGHPSQFRRMTAIKEQSFEIMRANNFKIKDFVEEAVRFTKPLEEEAPFIKNSKIESRNHGRALQILKEERQKLE